VTAERHLHVVPPPAPRPRRVRKPRDSGKPSASLLALALLARLEDVPSGVAIEALALAHRAIVQRQHDGRRSP